MFEVLASTVANSIDWNANVKFWGGFRVHLMLLKTRKEPVASVFYQWQRDSFPSPDLSGNKSLSFLQCRKNWHHWSPAKRVSLASRHIQDNLHRMWWREYHAVAHLFNRGLAYNVFGNTNAGIHGTSRTPKYIYEKVSQSISEIHLQHVKKHLKRQEYIL